MPAETKHHFGIYAGGKGLCRVYSQKTNIQVRSGRVEVVVVVV